MKTCKFPSFHVNNLKHKYMYIYVSAIKYKIPDWLE